MTRPKIIKMEHDCDLGLKLRDEVTIGSDTFIVTEWECRREIPHYMITLVEKTDFIRHSTMLTLAECDERVSAAVTTSPTCALVAELVRRTGVQEIECRVDQEYYLKILQRSPRYPCRGDDSAYQGSGPARILVVTD
jgi:hypothetical protein